MKRAAFAIALLVSTWEAEAMQTPEDRTLPASVSGFAELDGHRVAYETRGEGQRALVFVHGGSSERGVWQRQLAGLAGDNPLAGRRLVAIDLIGHGESAAPQIAYSMETLARSVAAVLDELELSRAILVGHSNGVPVVRQFLRLYPERVEALVLVDGALSQPLSPAMAQWMRSTLDSPDYDALLKQMVAGIPAGDVPPDDLKRLQAAQLATPRHVLAGCLDGLMDESIWAEDPIDVPLLVVLSGSQRLANADYEALARRLATSIEYHVWDDVSHFLMLEQPARFNTLLAAFVVQVDTPGP